MLSFDIRSLESKAEAVDGELPPADPVWEAGDPVPDAPIRVTGRLSAAGPGRFYFSGRMQGPATGECRRCLTDVHSVVDADVHLIFAEEGLDDEDDESDAYPFAPSDRLLDLRPAVREEWLLAAPAYPLCREDCRGLCPQCGADLNADPQHAHATTDSRWETLRDALGGAGSDRPAAD
jgi:uncharacterized protein